VISINTRMLITAGIVLVGFLGITGMTLERSFIASAEEALKERLRANLTAVIASSDIREDGALELAYALPETRFFNEGSGLYAKILGNNGKVLWASPSLGEMTIPVYSGLVRGESLYERLKTSDGTPVLAYSLGVAWEDDEKFKAGYTFVVAESLDRFNQQVVEFSRNLWGWLAGVTVVLLIMLTMILRWGLSPLRRVAQDLREIEAGRHQDLIGHYPKELCGLTDNLNALIRTNREHEERYQASLGDLAHSLKTPLAVLRGMIEAPHQSISSMRGTVAEQVRRMDEIVQYQLQRAATSGRTALMAPVDVAAIANRVVKALHKVYADKGVESRVEVQPQLEFHGNEGDLMELLGNVIDNAFKWSSGRVEVRIGKLDGVLQQQSALVIEVMDDGPGIEAEKIATVLERGGRLDTRVNGHGLGLALVSDIVALYHGRLEIERAGLGGALVRIGLPWR
jgi:two-component system sensor histidine kinase PhoQ